TFSDPAVTVRDDFTGYLYYLHGNHPALNPARICNAIDRLELFPSTDVVNVPPMYGSSATWSPSAPLTNQGGRGPNGGSPTDGCGAGDLYFRDDSAREGAPSYQFNFIADNSYLAPPIPAGDWTVSLNGTAIAQFDGQLGTPFEDDVTPTLTSVFVP